jgi:integrase
MAEEMLLRGPHTRALTTRTGLPLSPRNVNRWFDARCKRYGVRRIAVHDTCRTCGSLLTALDVHPRVAVAILRHSRIAMTMEIYTQVPDKATRDALRRLSAELEAVVDVDDQVGTADDGGAAG